MQDFHRAILDAHPQIIHFSGHGTGEEGLALEDNQGNIVFLETERVERLFKLFAKKGVECVFLNACYSEVQAKAIQKHIPYVVGMNQSITDEAAILFSTSFYDAIGAGDNVEFAFELGCIQLMGLGKEYNSPTTQAPNIGDLAYMYFSLSINNINDKHSNSSDLKYLRHKT